MTTPTPEPPAPGPSTLETQAVKRRTWRRKLELIWGSILLVIVLGGAIYISAMLKIAYSEGSKAGYLQVFEDRGWLCKTSEGTLQITSAPGVAPETWNFTVRDAKVAATLRTAVGKRVLLFYEEHRNLPNSCFGATDFFVDSVTVQP